MAELGAIASIVGIAAAGAKISMTLYELGSTARSAKSEVNKIAISIATFCSVLQQLASTLEKARSARFSISAIGTTQEILDGCQDIFDEIKEIIENLKIAKDSEANPTQISVAYVMRVKWVFKRVKVQKLQAELESMKLTLTIMLTTLNLAERIRSRRESEMIPGQETRNEDEEIQSIGANLLIAQQCAEDEINELEALGEGQDVPEEERDFLLLDSQSTTQWNFKRRQSYRASLWMEDSSSKYDSDPAIRPISWVNGKPTGNTGELFINLLKRWANCDPSDNDMIKHTTRQTPALRGPIEASSAITELTAAPHHQQQDSNTSALVPIPAYILARIESFQKDPDSLENLKGLTIDLSNRLLMIFPQEVVSLAGNKISRLALSNNLLKRFSVPSNTFTNLRYLNMRGNKFETIPQAITEISTLEVLDLSYNRLESVPGSLANLTSLKVISIQKNYISRPPFILVALNLLQVILISGNPFLYMAGYEKFNYSKKTEAGMVALSLSLKEKLLEDSEQIFSKVNQDPNWKLQDDRAVIEAYNNGTLFFEEEPDVEFVQRPPQGKGNPGTPRRIH